MPLAAKLDMLILDADRPVPRQRILAAATGVPAVMHLVACGKRKRARRRRHANASEPNRRGELRLRVAAGREQQPLVARRPADPRSHGNQVSQPVCIAAVVEWSRESARRAGGYRRKVLSERRADGRFGTQNDRTELILNADVPAAEEIGEPLGRGGRRVYYRLEKVPIKPGPASAGIQTQIHAGLVVDDGGHRRRRLHGNIRRLCRRSERSRRCGREKEFLHEAPTEFTIPERTRYINPGRLLLQKGHADRKNSNSRSGREGGGTSKCEA